jgi:predicted  nucleic acid-binding Zn-ribbon protein
LGKEGVNEIESVFNNASGAVTITLSQLYVDASLVVTTKQSISYIMIAIDNLLCLQSNQFE